MKYHKQLWDTLKKELTKDGDPYDLEGCMSLSVQQFRGRIASILLNNLVPYEKEIKAREEAIAKAMTYENWTDEAKAKFKAENEEVISKYVERLNLYGTKRREAEVKIEKITATDAWKVFAESVGVKRLYLDTRGGVLYLLVHY